MFLERKTNKGSIIPTFHMASELTIINGNSFTTVVSCIYTHGVIWLIAPPRWEMYNQEGMPCVVKIFLSGFNCSYQ